MDSINKIQKLRDSYKSSFIEKSATISELLGGLSSAVSKSVNRAVVSDKVCIEIHEYMHKLAGSSGMYGYPDIAKLAIASMQSSEHNDTQQLVEQLIKLRDLLQQSA